ncbi:MAG: lipopolysaccharide kinase InaA family protein [Acidobacteriota bacterium]
MPADSPIGPDPRCTFAVGDVTCLCRETLSAELRALYARHRWIYDVLRADARSEVLRGRRPVLAGTLPGGTALVVKRLHHGGALAPLTGDRFLSADRFRTQVGAADRLRGAGVATPAALFASWRRLAGFVRGEVGSERIAGARDASDALFGRPGELPPQWREIATSVGDLAGRLHAAGACHGDLNLMNVLFPPAGPPMILDLDKVSFLGPPLPAGVGRRTLGRLLRSVRKQGRSFPALEVEAVVATVVEAYEAAVA